MKSLENVLISTAIIFISLTSQALGKELQLVANWDALVTELNKKPTAVMFYLGIKDQPRCDQMKKDLEKLCDQHATFECLYNLNFFPNEFSKQLNIGDGVAPYIAFFKNGDQKPVIELKETDEAEIKNSDIEASFNDPKLK